VSICSYPTDQPGDVTELAARIGRIEAVMAVQRAHNDYFYLLDSGRTDELLDLYTEDVSWSASNIPFGSGKSLALIGRAQVRPIVERLGYGGFRHHGLNIDITVDESAEAATSSSYMLVISRSPEVADSIMLLGGLYEGTWTRDADRWRIARWQISHQYLIDGIAKEKFFDGLREGTRWDGYPRLEAL
jgi:hypothetical protein